MSEKYKDFVIGSQQNNSPAGSDLLAVVKADGSVTNKVLVSALSGPIKLIASKIGYNLNSTSDQSITLPTGTFVETYVLITNAKDGSGNDLGSVNAKDFQIQDAASRAGNGVCASVYNALTHIDESLILLTAKNIFVDSLTNIGTTALVLNESNITISGTLYASLGTAQGSAATMDIYIVGIELS